MEVIENMATSDHAILRDRTHIPTKRSLLELSSQDALLSQNKLLAKQLESFTETLSKLPTQLQAAQPSHSVVLQVGGCSIYGESKQAEISYRRLFRLLARSELQSESRARIEVKSRESI